MSLETPTISDINNTIIAQLETSLGQTIPFLPKSFIRVLAKTLAGLFVVLYKYGGFIFLQMFVKTALNEETTINGKSLNPLIEWGRLIGTGDPIAATQAELVIDITVINQAGSLPSGTQLLNNGNGVTYITIGSVLLNSATVQATIRAVSDQQGGGGAGAIGNLSPGDVVSFANSVANVNNDAVVASQTVTGANAESTEVYRQRVVDRFQKRPQGGAYSDYELWGEEVPGIINVYPYTGNPGQVNVYSEATEASSGSADGIPTTAQLEAVLNNINLDGAGVATRRNANCFVNSFPISRLSFNVEVSGIQGVDDLAQVQTDITTALTDYFRSIEPFIAGLSVPPRNDQITRTKISAIVEDIVTAAGGTFSNATYQQTGIPVDLDGYAVSEGQKTKMNLLTFSA
jgi:uncharacterized phage protein gp47/JayE